jgi:DNA repair ATPase RecN
MRTLIKVKPDFTKSGSSRFKVVVGLCPNSHTWQNGDGHDLALDARSISGRIVHRAVDRIDNVILTNMTNWTLDPKQLDESLLRKGINELRSLFRKYNPTTIICLGSQIYERINHLHHNAAMHSVHHPAFVNRFAHSEVDEYIKTIKELLCH